MNLTQRLTTGGWRVFETRPPNQEDGCLKEETPATLLHFKGTQRSEAYTAPMADAAAPVQLCWPPTRQLSPPETILPTAPQPCSHGAGFLWGHCFPRHCGRHTWQEVAPPTVSSLTSPAMPPTPPPPPPASLEVAQLRSEISELRQLTSSLQIPWSPQSLTLPILLPLHCEWLPFSARSTSWEHTITSLWSPQTSPRWPWSCLSNCLSSPTCPLVCVMLLSSSRGSSTRSFVVSPAAMPTWMTFWLPARTRTSICPTYTMSSPAYKTTTSNSMFPSVFWVSLPWSSWATTWTSTAPPLQGSSDPGLAPAPYPEWVAPVFEFGEILPSFRPRLCLHPPTPPWPAIPSF